MTVRDAVPARAQLVERRTSGRKVPGASEAVSAAPALQSSRWLQTFMILEFACQIALLFPGISALRVVMRSAAFAVSLLLLLLPGKGLGHHAARPAAIAIILILMFSIFHPTTSSAVAGVATVFLNLAILGPLFWVPKVKLDAADIRRLFLLVWGFQTASAAVGALQVYFPTVRPHDRRAHGSKPGWSQNHLGRWYAHLQADGPDGFAGRSRARRHVQCPLFDGSLARAPEVVVPRRVAREYGSRTIRPLSMPGPIPTRHARAVPPGRRLGAGVAAALAAHRRHRGSRSDHRCRRVCFRDSRRPAMPLQEDCQRWSLAIRGRYTTRTAAFSLSRHSRTFCLNTRLAPVWVAGE